MTDLWRSKKKNCSIAAHRCAADRSPIGHAIKNLRQVLVGVVLGYFTTFCNWCVSLLSDPASIVIRLGLLLCVVLIAFGIFLYLPPDIMPLAGERTIQAISNVSGLAFARVKVLFDSSMVAIPLISCLAFLHSFGSVGAGTIIAAVLVGTVLGVFTRHLSALRDRWLTREKCA